MKFSKSRLTLIMTLLILATVALAGCGGSSAPAAVAAAPAAPAAQAQAQLEALTLPVDINAAKTNEIRGRDDVVIVDVREDWEYAEGHVPGAVLIPLGELSARLDEIPKDKTVVAVCRSGNRSNQATSFLRGQGFDNVHNMTGGMNDWQRAGYEVER